MKKSQQDELKDVGGFVAGELKDNRRKAENVLNRCLVTLDADNIEPGQTQKIINTSCVNDKMPVHTGFRV